MNDEKFNSGKAAGRLIYVNRFPGLTMEEACKGMQRIKDFYLKERVVNGRRPEKNSNR